MNTSNKTLTPFFIGVSTTSHSIFLIFSKQQGNKQVSNSNATAMLQFSQNSSVEPVQYGQVYTPKTSATSNPIQMTYHLGNQVYLLLRNSAMMCMGIISSNTCTSCSSLSQEVGIQTY